MKQKKKIKDFVNVIINKPVKVVISTSAPQKKNEKNNYQKIQKTRVLYIRTFLINQGISHNRITIKYKKGSISKNWKNEVILSFIGV